jgi:hypothetical protein
LGFGRDINASRGSGEAVLETITTYLRAQKQKRRVPQYYTTMALYYYGQALLLNCVSEIKFYIISFFKKKLLKIKF